MTNGLLFARRWKLSGNNFLLVMALLVGVGGGFFAVFFRWLIRLFQGFFFQEVSAWLSSMGGYEIVLIPALGAMLYGPLIYFLAREAKGHGVPEVMAAVALQGGRIRPRVVLVKALASALTIGSGGSVGREGPIVQIGSAIGSTVGQFFRLRQNMVKTLVGCGAAAGVAATFNAPIAGVLFAMELIVGEFTAATFSMIVISSVAASVVARVLLGDNPAFALPLYELVNPVELLFYVVLGLLAALVGRGFTVILYATEDLFDSFKGIPEYVKPVIGGLILGALALYAPEIMGVGYESMELALEGRMAVGLVAALLLLKPMATAITIGAGGSGGVFAPSLFIGSMLGALFGHAVNGLYPGLTGSPGAYALVGMGAVFAGVSQAPLTAIVILFELTRDYHIILPVMLATVVASLTAGALSRETIYTLKLLRRGITLKSGRDVNIMRALKVADAMRTQVDTVRDDMTVGDVVSLMQRTRHTGFPILDREGRLCGIITLKDIRDIRSPNRLSVPVSEVCSRKLITVTPEEDLEAAMHKLSYEDVGRLPVVDVADPARLVGLITRSDIIRAYDRALLHDVGEPPHPANGRARGLRTERT